MTPALFVQLANLHRPRRAGYEADDGDRQVLETLSETAGRGGGDAAPEVDRLATVVSNLADAIVAQHVPLPVGKLNALAHAATSFPRLVADPTRLALKLERRESPTDPIAALAARVVTELVAADLTRIKECARDGCTLVFYDDTRSRTRRWHAEAPCGRLERQRRHRQAEPTAS